MVVMADVSFVVIKKERENASSRGMVYVYVTDVTCLNRMRFMYLYKIYT